jgi:luciferase family oxidoreductase group 1
MLRTLNTGRKMADLKNVFLSILDLAHLRQGGTTQEAFRNTLDLAQRAEQWGYKRFWLAEHHNIPGVACSATSVLIAHVAGGTSTIRVGSGGVMLPNHAPLVIAEQFGTLETLFPGRIDLGLGRAPGGDFAVMRALRRGLGTEGDDFPELLDELRGYLAPSSPGRPVQAIPGAGSKIPIWLLGSSGFSAQLAGHLGLPFAFAAHFQPDNLLPALKLYRESFRPSESRAHPYVMVGIPAVLANTDEHAQFLATTHQQLFLNLIRNQPGPMMPPVEKLDWTPFEERAVRSKYRAAIVGSPKTAQHKLEELLNLTQADEFIVVTNTFEHEDRLHSYELLSRLVRGDGLEDRHSDPPVVRNSSALSR